jgi:hypothetical protein
MIRENNIHHNETGGIQIRSAEFQNCFVVGNTIHHNFGPDICQYVLSDNSNRMGFNFKDSRFQRSVYLLGNICYNNVHYKWLKVFHNSFPNAIGKTRERVSMCAVAGSFE